MFAFHWMKCIIISVTLRVGSAAFVPFAPTTLSSKIHVTHFTCPKPQSSSSLVVVTQQISPATSSTALNVGPNNFNYDLRNLIVGSAALQIVVCVAWVGTSIDKPIDKIDQRFDRIDQRLDRIDTRFDKIDTLFDKIDTQMATDKADLDKRLDVIEADIKGLYSTFKNYLLTGKIPTGHNETKQNK